MKKLIIAIAVLMGLTATAQASCSSQLASWKSEDSMVNSYQITGSETIIWVNNIRNFKAIDIGFYGFNDSQASQLESKHGCKSVRFEEAYTELGMPRTQPVKAIIKEQAGTLESALESVIAQADACIAKNDCESFVWDNPMMIEVLGNHKFVQQLDKCKRGSRCYSLNMVATQKSVKAMMSAIDNM